MFGLILWVVLILRWLPLAMHVGHGASGVIAVVGGDLLLGWKCLVRIGAAYVPTVALWPLLPSLRQFEAFAVAGVAVVIEFIAELTTSALFGGNAALPIQLTLTALGYGVTTVGVLLLLWRRPRDGSAF
jgi:hypothetical protein